VSDRLADGDEAKIVAARQIGVSVPEVATRFGISESSVKRITRKHAASLGRGKYPRKKL